MTRDTANPDIPHYRPLYFLAPLGAGGLVVTFFLWLMFWVPHPGQPVPLFEDIRASFLAGGAPHRAMIVAAYLGIGVFAVMHVRFLVRNIAAYRAFRHTPAWRILVAGNTETQLLAIPLALAMSINVGFILAMVAVPGLWGVVDYLFPVAMTAFLGIGVYALALMGDFLGRVLTRGGFDCARNNSFVQLLPAFAFSMVGVGLAAPAGMSGDPLTTGLSYLASSFFIIAAMILGAVALFLGFRAMMEQGADSEAAPSLWIAIPIMTVIGIALMRQEHGLHAHFERSVPPVETWSLLTRLLAVQLLFGLLGAVVLVRQRYFARFVLGPERSAGSYALVCPAVALAVLMQFFVNKGLVAVGLVDRFSLAYWTLTGAALALQAAAIWLMATLNARHRPARLPVDVIRTA